MAVFYGNHAIARFAGVVGLEPNFKVRVLYLVNVRITEWNVAESALTLAILAATAALIMFYICRDSSHRAVKFVAFPILMYAFGVFTIAIYSIILPNFIKFSSYFTFCDDHGSYRVCNATAGGLAMWLLIVFMLLLPIGVICSWFFS
jgi:hypothetical protein